MSQVPISYPVGILLGSGYNLAVFHISNKLDIVAFSLPEQYHFDLGVTKQGFFFSF